MLDEATLFFATFYHRLLQLTWSSVSLKLWMQLLKNCWFCSFSQPFPVQITFFPSTCEWAMLICMWWSGPSSNTWFLPWACPSPHPKRHLDRFSCFCSARDCDRPTDRDAVWDVDWGRPKEGTMSPPYTTNAAVYSRLSALSYHLRPKIQLKRHKIRTDSNVGQCPTGWSPCRT